MSRCKHENFDLAEWVSALTSFEFREGKPPKDGIGWNSDLHPAGTISVHCHDCGLSHEYHGNAKRPKWVDAAWQALMDEQQKEYM